MPVAPGTSSCLAIFVSAPTLMSLSVARSMRSMLFGWRGGAVSAWGAAAAGGVGLRLFVSVSISFHSSSSPSPVTAETGSTESSKTDSSSLSARIRSPRASLSILVATTARLGADRRCSHCQAATIARRARDAAHRPAAARCQRRSHGERTASASSARDAARQFVELAGRRARSRSPGRSTRYSGGAGPARDTIDVRQPRLAGRRARARHALRTSALIRLDLPTFDRPTKATSGIPSAGNRSRSQRS